MLATHKTVGGQRLHQTPIGLLPGVTTIAKCSEPDITDAIIQSYSKPGVDHLGRGNIVEAAIDRYLDIGLCEIEPQYRPWLVSVLPELDKVERIYDRQQQIIGELRGLRYAGSYDFYGEIVEKGQTIKVVIDWKAPASRRARSSAQCIGYLCQIAAYWHAIGDDLIDEARIIFALPNGNAHVMRLKRVDAKNETYEQMLELFENWLVQWYDRYGDLVS
jgi:hypothetical protein